MPSQPEAACLFATAWAKQRGDGEASSGERVVARVNYKSQFRFRFFREM